MSSGDEQLPSDEEVHPHEALVAAVWVILAVLAGLLLSLGLEGW